MCEENVTKCAGSWSEFRNLMSQNGNSFENKDRW